MAAATALVEAVPSRSGVRPSVSQMATASLFSLELADSRASCDVSESLVNYLLSLLVILENRASPPVFSTMIMSSSEFDGVDGRERGRRFP